MSSIPAIGSGKRFPRLLKRRKTFFEKKQPEWNTGRIIKWRGNPPLQENSKKCPE
jgi:hypothetical protein